VAKALAATNVSIDSFVQLIEDAPRTVQSGRKTGRARTGKGNPYLKSAFAQIATGAAKTDTFLGERYRRLIKRMPKAKALVALQRSILVIFFHLLADPTAEFTDLGSDFYAKRIDRARRTTHLLRQLHGGTKLSGGKLPSVSQLVRANERSASGRWMATSWATAPPVSLPTRSTCSRPRAAHKSMTASAIDRADGSSRAGLPPCAGRSTAMHRVVSLSRSMALRHSTPLVPTPCTNTAAGPVPHSV